MRVLTEPRHALLKQYGELFRQSNAEFHWTKAALRKVAARAKMNGTGTRGLRSMMERLLLEPMYDVPDTKVGGGCCGVVCWVAACCWGSRFEVLEMQVGGAAAVGRRVG